MKSRMTWSVLALGVVLAQPSQAQEKLLVQAVLDPKIHVVEAVKRECALDGMVGNSVLESVSKKYRGATRLEKGASAGKSRLLKVTIINVVGVGGGAYSGPKSMTVRADLLESGKVIATTTKERTSGGGAFGGMKGTCSIFGRVAKTLGSDVAGWLPSAMK